MEPLRSEERTPESSELVSLSTELPEVVPVRTALEAADAPRTFWSVPGEPTVVGSGAAWTLIAEGPDRFDDIRSEAETLFETVEIAGTTVARPRVFGGFSFHHDHTGGDPWKGFPAAKFVLPGIQITYDEDRAWVTVNAVDVPRADVKQRLETIRAELPDHAPSDPPADPPGIKSRTRTTSLDVWRDSVSSATDRIERGELEKVVLAQALEAQLNRTPKSSDIVMRLEESYPDCFRFVFDEGSASFLGATPERLVDLRGRTVETGALAGTTGRGDTPEEDDWLAAELLDDDKNRHEHELVVDAIGEQLAPFASSIRTGDRDVRKLATVQHIETPITATLEDDEHVLSLVEALHPTPAVGGLPPDEALSTIRETESFRRGWYAAPIGWFDAAGDGSFAVAIRSAVTRDDVATLFAGVGIVADSDPDLEWEEVQLKYRPILDELA